MGLDTHSPFTGKETFIDLPDASGNDPFESSKPVRIETKPDTMSNLIPVTKG